MLHITRLMIARFQLDDTDFMGYTFDRKNASYHHLIVPRRLGGPKTIDNGAVLNGKTSHPYLHLVEGRDYEIFCMITSEMIDQNLKRKIDINNLKRIDDLLKYFEKEHCGDTNSYDEPLIKEEYVKRLIKKD